MIHEGRKGNWLSAEDYRLLEHGVVFQARIADQPIHKGTYFSYPLGEFVEITQTNSR